MNRRSNVDSLIFKSFAQGGEKSVKGSDQTSVEGSGDDASVEGSVKIVAFDFDGTLAITSFNSKMVLPRDMQCEDEATRLKHLSDSGYELVIMTNSAEIGIAKKPDARASRVKRKLGRIETFIAHVNKACGKELSFHVLVATDYDQFRKPSTKDRKRQKEGGTGMWDFLRKKILPSSASINLRKVSMLVMRQADQGTTATPTPFLREP